MPEHPYLVEGAKTRLRPFTRGDVDVWLGWPQHRDPLFDAYNAPSMSSGMRDAWFDDLVGRQGQQPFAADTLEGRLIGRVFLRHQHRPPGTATLGVDLHPDYLGQGFGTDALGAFLPFFFGRLGFDKLYLSVGVYNGRAHRVYTRLGFAEVNEHWERIRTSAPVLHDRRYAAIAHLFRRGAPGLEALHYLMALDRTRFESLARDRATAHQR